MHKLINLKKCLRIDFLKAHLSAILFIIGMFFISVDIVLLIMMYKGIILNQIIYAIFVVCGVISVFISIWRN